MKFIFIIGDLVEYNSSEEYKDEFGVMLVTKIVEVGLRLKVIAIDKDIVAYMFSMYELSLVQRLQ